MKFIRRCQWSIKEGKAWGALSIGDTWNENEGWKEALHGAGGGEAILGRKKSNFRQRDKYVYIWKPGKFTEWHVVS